MALARFVARTSVAFAFSSAALVAQDLRPSALPEVIEATCADCHRGADAEGGFDIGQLATGDPTAWLAATIHVRDRVASREMPPEDFGALDDEEFAAILAWSEARLAALDALDLPPGSVTVRRLSRFEYDNTVRDLFGLTPEASASFPAENLGYGFDNVGSALTLSTLHLEKYLDAAQEVAELVVECAHDAPRVRRIFGAKLNPTRGRGIPAGDAQRLITAGTLETWIASLRPGRYELEVLASGDQAGDEPVEMRVRTDGGLDRTVHVKSVRGDVETHRFALDLTERSLRVRVSFLNDYYDPKFKDPKRRDRNLIVEGLVLHGPLLPEVAVATEWLRRADPGESASVDVRSRALARAVARRVWRQRVAPAADARRLARVYRSAHRAAQARDAEAGGRAAADAALTAMLAYSLGSPRFLFRIEGAPTAGTRKLAGEEIASRLSYFLWSSAPDEALLADARELTDPLMVRAAAARMLEDPRAARLATGFAAQWLELRNLAMLQPDPDKFPAATPELRAAMRRETELVFDAVLRERRPVLDLVDADFTFVNAPLADHYGIEWPGADARGAAATPEGWVRVPALRPGGVLGHASVLTLTSNPTRTSPVKRGLWILDNLLDAPPPPPAPGDDSFADEAALHSAQSMREQLAQHRRDPACAVCHVRMDGLGLSLEGFDAVGRSRVVADGTPIDTRGVLPGGRKIEGLEGVRDALRDDARQVVRALARRLFVYAVGRDTTDADRLALERMVRRMMEERPAVTVRDLILGIVELDAFWRADPVTTKEVR